MQCTPEQSAAIAAQGKIIVSASAGSGKTFVMIQKLCNFLENGGDLDSVLAVTFTKKAAAQIKEKLRKTLISRLPGAGEAERANIKTQLGKIPSADISTIHSFCARLIRTHFYALDIDRSFDIVVDDARITELRERAMDNLFDRLYSSGDANFKIVLDCLRRNRSDSGIRGLIFDAYDAVRNIVDYRHKLEVYPDIYCEEGFEKVCRDLQEFTCERCLALSSALGSFMNSLDVPPSLAKLNSIAGEISRVLERAAHTPLFESLPPLPSTQRPRAKTEEEKAVSERFRQFREQLKKRYESFKKDIGTEEDERAAFMTSGRLASAFSAIVLQFDDEYMAVKRDENKLDPADLEHLTLALLEDEGIRKGVNERYKNIFVDEYQDVNPVQERILSLAGNDQSFTVGDVKQAIYGFRGSKSVFFSRKYEAMSKREGALRLSVNFRSSDGVLNFVNSVFGDIMTPSSCGIDYAAEGTMKGGGKYPAGYGSAGFVVFGGEEKQKSVANGVYSVCENANRKVGHTREGLAVLEIVRRELSRQHYSVEEGKMVDTQPGDICILTRKNAGDSTTGIVRALTDAGYDVEGAGDGDLLKRSEIRQLLDILSLIDNCQQDIPLSTALLSPLGGFTRDELARIRISQNSATRLTFRDCLVNYRMHMRDGLAHKISAFFAKINNYRRLTDILGAASLIDKILSDTGLGARYAAGGGSKLAGVRRLQQEAYSGGGELSLNAFLSRIKAAGRLKSAPPSTSDSIKMVTMHSSKGLEYPVVIVADIARRYGSNDTDEIPFDDEYGFAPRAFDTQNMLCRATVLRNLCAKRARREEIKNELNLFYVACTRAMCNLYVLCGEVPKYDPAAFYEADCYAKMLDVTAYSPEYMSDLTDFDADNPIASELVAEGGDAGDISSLFGARYPYAASVDLAVKTSASQLMRDEEALAEQAYLPHYLFDDEYDGDASEGGREAGTAYHRYLELCDLSVNDEAGISAQLEKFVAEGHMSAGQRALLDVPRLQKILSMPAFAAVKDATLFREREFLCALLASDVYETTAADKVLVQGAIDLLVVGKEGVSIIDYKFVKLPPEELKKKYSRQLNLYKKAAGLIMRIDPSAISARIIDLRHLVEINV